MRAARPGSGTPSGWSTCTLCPSPGSSRTTSTGRSPGAPSAWTTCWTSPCRGACDPVGQLDGRLAQPPREGEPYPVLVREYQTPKGMLRHEVRQTGEEQARGLGDPARHRSPDRGLQHPARGTAPRERAGGRGTARVLLPAARRRGARRGLPSAWREVKQFPGTGEDPVQAWAGFGMDAVVWFCGTEGAILLALDHPREFQELFESITETDRARVELAAAHPGRRPRRGDGAGTRPRTSGRPRSSSSSSSRTSARSPPPPTAHGKKFAYVMTTGVESPRPAAGGGRRGRAVLRRPAGPGTEGTLPGEGPGPALGFHDAGGRNQLDHAGQPGHAAPSTGREARAGRARARPTVSSCTRWMPCSPTPRGNRWRG